MPGADMIAFCGAVRALAGFVIVVGIIVVAWTILRSSGPDSGGTHEVVCKSCQARNPPQARFCRQCGARLV